MKDDFSNIANQPVKRARTPQEDSARALRALRHYDMLKFVSRHDEASTFKHIDGTRRIRDDMLPAIYTELREYRDVFKTMVENGTATVAVQWDMYFNPRSQLNTRPLYTPQVLREYDRMLVEILKARRALRHAQRGKPAQISP